MSDNISEAYIEGIKQIANSKQIKQACEPNVMWHEDIKDGQVLRVLHACKLLQDNLKALN